MNIKKLIVKYDREDFFGNLVYTEDVNSYPERADIFKSFRAMRKTPDMAIDISSDKEYVVVWDSNSDFENGICKLITYHSPNCKDEQKMVFEKVKTMFLRKEK